MNQPDAFERLKNLKETPLDTEQFRKVSKEEALKIAVDLPPPTGAEIDEVLSIIQDRLELPAMRTAANWSVMRGYEAAVVILAEEIRVHADLPDGLIDNLNSTVARAIAQATIEYLNGQMTREFLISIPIKE